MTYAEKLKDPRWIAFRSEFLSAQESEDGEIWCSSCGDEANHQKAHVHHTVYRSGKEPWEYQFKELRLLCARCHGELHAVEKGWRAFLISIPMRHISEADDLLEALLEVQRMAPDRVGIAMAHCKNAARDFAYKMEQPGVVRTMRESIIALAEKYKKEDEG